MKCITLVFSYYEYFILIIICFIFITVGGSEEETEEIVSVNNKEDLTEKQKHQMKHRELFLSRQVETLPATHIRGKCNITLLNETELYSSYLSKDVRVLRKL